ASNPQETRVPRCGMSRQNQSASARVNAVAGEHDVSRGDAPVFKMRDDRVASLIERAQALAVRHRHTAAGRLVEQDAMKRGTKNGDAVSRTGDIDSPDRLASLIPKDEVTRWHAGRGNLTREAECPEYAHAVWRDLKPAADCGG